MAGPLSRPATSLAAFAAHLSAHGFTVVPSDSVAAATVLATADLADRALVRLLLKLVYARSAQQWQRFDALFDEFFLQRSAGPPMRRVAERDDAVASGFGRGQLARPEPRTRGRDLARARLAYSPRWGERFDIAVWEGAQLQALRSVVRRMAEVLPRRPRVRRGAPGAGRLDLRRTVHAGIARGGDPLVLLERARAPGRPMVVMVLDLSGSMREHGSFLVSWAWTLLRTQTRLEVFAFSTDLVRMTPALRAARPGRPLGGPWDDLPGGTRIGPALDTLLHRYRDVLSHQTTLLIASDGFDAGGAPLIDRTMRALKAQVFAVWWINPAAASPGYEPRAAGIRAALPHVTHHLAVHSPAALHTALAAGNFGPGAHASR